MSDAALRLALAAALLASPACRPATRAPQATAIAATPYRLVNAMPELWRVMDETAGRDDAAWIEAYRTRIVAPNSALFLLARGGLDDSTLVRYRRALLRNGAAYRALADSLPARLASRWRRLAAGLPDARPGAVLYLLPAPPGAIGGWYRPLPEHDAVVFGFSLLASARSDAELAERVDHELAHLYHAQVNAGIREMVASFFMGSGDHATALYELMWVEGFAVHVARRLAEGGAPTAVPASATAARHARALRERMDETERRAVEGIVYEGTGPIPPGAVTEVGALVAERLAARLGVAATARLSGAALRDAIRRELEAIGGAP